MFLQKLKENQTIFKNTGYLSLIEIMRLILPLVALPYVIRMVGADNYGRIAFAQTIITYFITFINFGLDISAVKNVSVHRDNTLKLNTIVSSVLIIKSILFVISFITLLTGIICIPYLYEYRWLYLFAFITCLSEILFPIWFYQGIEKMKYLPFIRFTSILFYTASVFIFIKSREDYLYVALLQSLGNILAGGLSFYFIVKVEKIKLVKVPFHTVKFYFLESIPFFVSRLSVVFNNGLAKIMCGVLFSMHAVAAFDLAQKVATFSLIPMQMLNQAAYPHIAKTKSKSFVTKFLVLNIIVSFSAAVFIGVFAPYISWFFAGDTLPESVPLIRILCLYVFCGGITIYLGAPVLVSFGYNKVFNRSVIISSVVLALLYAIFYFANILSIYIFAISLFISELIIFLIRIYYVKRYNLI